MHAAWASWDRVLLLALAALGAGLCATDWVLTALVLSALILAHRARLGNAGALLASLLIALCGARALSASCAYERHWTHARDDFGPPARCAFSATVANSPTLRGDALSFHAVVHSAQCGETDSAFDLRGSTIRLYGGPADLGRGDRVNAIAQLGVLRLFKNSELAAPFPSAARSGVVLSGSVLSLDVVERGRGIRRRIDALRGVVRDRICAHFPGPAQGMARALVLGENDLPDEESDAFKQSGLAHVLAVSGTHLIFAVVSIIGVLTGVLLRWPALAERVRADRISAVVGIPLSLLYADFAGGSGSAWRAAWMLSAAYLVRALDRETANARVVAASVLIGVCIDPLAIYDLSFLLSLAATAGLMTLGAEFRERLPRLPHRGLRLLVEGMIATCASVIPCSALLALLAPSVSLAGIFVNVFVAPFGEVIALPLCLGHASLVMVTPFSLELVERGLATIAAGALLIVKQAALATADFSQHSHWINLPLPMPTRWHYAVLALGVVSLTRRSLLGQRQRARLRNAAIGWLLALLMVERLQRDEGSPTGQLRVTVLDVGQGDASLVDLPDGQLMLIDAGGFVGSPVDPGMRVVLPVLRARRREHLDVIVLSHPHPDHYGGLLSVVERTSVGEFWDTGQGWRESPAPEYTQLLRTVRARGIVVRTPRELCGTRDIGGASMDVIGPCPDVIPNRNPNDNSWVIRIRYGDRAVLFTGDAEQQQESELLALSPRKLRADFLKVGHHGSRTSTRPDFLRAVSPAVAVASCGVRNRFGHPHPSTLETLRRGGVPLLRTDLHGSVMWSTDGNLTQTRAFSP